MSKDTTDKHLDVLTGWGVALALLLPAFLAWAIYVASGPLHIAWGD